MFEKVCLPADVLTMGENAINALWREVRMKAVGIKNATRLVDDDKNSIGLTCRSKEARMQMQLLLQEYKNQQKIDAQIIAEIEEILLKVPGSQELLKIKGIPYQK